MMSDPSFRKTERYLLFELGSKSGAVGPQKSFWAVYFTIILLLHSFILGFLNCVLIPLQPVHSISSPGHAPVAWKCCGLGRLTMRRCRLSLMRFNAPV
jgi:hypothetical protein